jgi:hypothetical protein
MGSMKICLGIINLFEKKKMNWAKGRLKAEKKQTIVLYWLQQGPIASLTPPPPPKSGDPTRPTNVASWSEEASLHISW